MKHARKPQRKIFSQTLALVLALTIMMSTVIVSGLSLTVFAAEGIGGSNQNVYLNFKQNNFWKSASSISVKFADSDGNVKKTVTASKVPDPNGLFSASCDGAGGATQMQIVNGTSPVGSNLPNNVPKSGYKRVYLNANSVSTQNDGKQKFNEPRIYYWENSTLNSDVTWESAPVMTKLSGDIWYYDIQSEYDRAIFCQNKDGGRYQTGDLPLSMIDGCSTLYFDGSNWRSSNITVANIANIKTGKNIVEYYMNSNGSFIQSNYLSTLTAQENFDNYPSQYDLKTVYVYCESWSSANQLYAYLDFGDPYSGSVTLEKASQGAYTVFKGKIPADARVRFAPNSLNTSMNVTSYPDSGTYDSTGYSDTTATYYMSGSAQGWAQFKEAVTNQYDAIIPDNFEHPYGDTRGSIIGVDATYIDYLSDDELNNGYLNTINDQDWKKGDGNGDDGKIENIWYQFDDFNSYISGKVSDNWKFPLYFGNLFYDYENHEKKDWRAEFDNHVVKKLKNHNTGWNEWKNYAVNNSNGMKRDGGNYNQSIQGLVGQNLDKNGNLLTPDGSVMPYFDVNSLTSDKYTGKNTNDVAKVFKSKFPFVATTTNNVTTYTFSSKNGQDNIFFAWDDKNPKYINYGAGSDYAVHDHVQSGPFGGDSDGYGIFPFNNNDSVKNLPKTPGNSESGTYNRNDNNNLDFGFGIRLDIDFKVPEDGLIGEATTPQPQHPTIYVKSNSDPYVYAWTGTDNKQLGDWPGTKLTQKNSEGYYYVELSNLSYTDDFNVIVHDGSGKQSKNLTGKGDTIIDATSGFNNATSSSSSSSGPTPVTFNFSGDDDLWVYIGEKQDGSDGKLVLDLGGDHKETQGNINFNTMLATAGDVYADYSSGTPSVKNSKNVTKQFNNGQHLDPNKTYHMTVFYMERGEAESNFSVGFTMTPANNDLQVEKNLVTEETDENGVTTKYVIDKIAEELEAKESYNYQINGEGNSSTNGKSYTFYSKEEPNTAVGKTVSNDDSFSLTNGDKADFENQFENNEAISVSESMANTALKYDTNWVLNDVDNVVDPVINTGNDVASSFNLINKSNDTSKNSNLLLVYNNKIKTSNLDITKKVFAEDKTTEYDTEQQFTFNVTLDLDGEGGNYQSTTYPLSYKKYDSNGVYINSGTLVDGKFTLRKGEKLELLDIPVGASYEVTEDGSVGYLFDGEMSKNMSGTIVDDNPTVEAVNIVNPVNSSIQITKKLDNAPYKSDKSGSAFKYTLTGFDAMDLGGGKKTLSTKTVNKVVETTDADGVAKFEDLSFVEPGKYRYQIVESLNVTDKFGFYNMDTSVILVEVEVDDTGTPQDPKFIVLTKEKYDTVKDNIKTVFDNPNEYDGYKSSAEFNNSTNKAKIVINKTNPNSAKIDAKFAVIRVSKAEGITNADVKKIMDDETLKSAVVAANGSTTDGTVEFGDLPIYQNGSKMYVPDSDPDSDSVIESANYLKGTYTPQIYCVVEYEATKGYNLNSTPYYVTFPVKAGDEKLADGYYEDGEGYVRSGDINSSKADDPYVFTQTFNYTNYPVVMPQASGDGMNGCIKLGLVIIAGAGVLTALYFGYNRLNRKRRMARYRADR